MKSNKEAFGCSTCEVGQEDFETYTSKGKTYVQYDYRDWDGELFSCFAPSLEVARDKRDKWKLNKKK